MFVACGIWCLADVSSVSPSSEQTEIHSVKPGKLVEIGGYIERTILRQRSLSEDKIEWP